MCILIKIVQHLNLIAMSYIMDAPFGNPVYSNGCYFDVRLGGERERLSSF